MVRLYLKKDTHAVAVDISCLYRIENNCGFLRVGMTTKH